MSGPERLPHLRIQRSEHRTKRRSGGNPRPQRPSGLEQHAAKLRASVEVIQADPPSSTGFDPRRLLKLEVQIGDPGSIEQQIPGLTVVSQEGKTVTVLFATQAGLETFRSRLLELEGRGKPKYQQLLWNVSEVGTWSAEDRRGRALAAEGVPNRPRFMVDVELWALDRVPDRREMVRRFDEWCRANDVKVLDRLADVATVVVARVEATGAGLELLLEHRDVRIVDLPPQFGFSFELLAKPLKDVGQVDPPPDNAPLIAVLDTGIVSNHPLLAPAVGDVQSFTNGAPDHDQNGHGTHVAGLAIYGDVETCTRESCFEPRLRLLSVRRKIK